MKMPIKVGPAAAAVMISFVTVAATSAVQPELGPPVPRSAFHAVAIPLDGASSASDPGSRRPAVARAVDGPSDASAAASTLAAVPAPVSAGQPVRGLVPAFGEAPAPIPEPAPRMPTPTAGSTTAAPSPAVWQVDPNVSWYGPGMYGHRTACGLELTQDLVGVAHRTLPCGTLVVFSYGGRTVTAAVVDRGPYVAGRQWDLTSGLALRLGHLFTGPLRWRLA